jgi:hypothetical protein
VETDFNQLLNVQPGLNPWLVVLLSSIAGLLAFALCNALYVVHVRHRRLSSKLDHPVVNRVRRMATATLVTSLVLALALSIPGPKLVDGTGWLSGDNLFSVSSRAGFAASYPNTAREVEKGDVILQLVRDAGPEEMAAATSRRALLAQDLEFSRLETLRVDPLLLAAHETENDALDALLERERTLMESHESLLRGLRRQQLSDQTALADVERELQAAQYELDQTESSFKAASASFELASRPDFAGVLPGDELSRREERVEVLRSRREELRERITLLTRERGRLKALTTASDATHADQMNLRIREIEEIGTAIAQARERRLAAWQAIEQDKLRAERQRESRTRQIELQIAELDELLGASAGVLDVRAPWDGFIGFREPSPASVRFTNRPLLVLYKSGSISVRIPVTADRAELAGADDIGIRMRALLPEAASTSFAGNVREATRLPDGSGELVIAGDPPEAAIRDLVSGNSVPVHVVIRRLNPLAAAGVGWAWWFAASLLAAAFYSEARLWWHRRGARSRGGQEPESAPASRFRIDWGGDPDEFLEYVAGVGVVPRKLRRAPAIEVAQERRTRMDPIATAVAQAKRQRSLPS